MRAPGCPRREIALSAHMPRPLRATQGGGAAPIALYSAADIDVEERRVRAAAGSGAWYAPGEEHPE